jgi:hypothetical protein
VREESDGEEVANGEARVFGEDLYTEAMAEAGRVAVGSDDAELALVLPKARIGAREGALDDGRDSGAHLIWRNDLDAPKSRRMGSKRSTSARLALDPSVWLNVRLTDKPVKERS